jgi:hypothetical protein
MHFEKCLGLKKNHILKNIDLKMLFFFEKLYFKRFSTDKLGFFLLKYALP